MCPAGARVYHTKSQWASRSKSRTPSLLADSQACRESGNFLNAPSSHFAANNPRRSDAERQVKGFSRPNFRGYTSAEGGYQQAQADFHAYARGNRSVGDTSDGTSYVNPARSYPSLQSPQPSRPLQPMENLPSRKRYRCEEPINHAPITSQPRQDVYEERPSQPTEYLPLYRDPQLSDPFDAHHYASVANRYEQQSRAPLQPTTNPPTRKRPRPEDTPTLTTHQPPRHITHKQNPHAPLPTPSRRLDIPPPDNEQESSDVEAPRSQKRQRQITQYLGAKTSASTARSPARAHRYVKRRGGE